MKSTPSDRPTQVQRRAAAEAKIFAATIELIAELGPAGFSLADAGARAGVSRGLPAYHFGTRDQLLAAVARRLVERLPACAESGLPGLFQWIEAELDLAVSAAPPTCALLRLLVAREIQFLDGERASYWETRLGFIERQLQVGQALQQVRADIDRVAIAPVLLAQLQGELFRLTWTRSKNDAFVDLMQKAIGVEAKTSVIARKPAPKRTAAKPSLF